MWDARGGGGIGEATGGARLLIGFRHGSRSGITTCPPKSALTSQSGLDLVLLVAAQAPDRTGVALGEVGEGLRLAIARGVVVAGLDSEGEQVSSSSVTVFGP
mgnify:FL=1